jgi:phage terminase small subunit
MAKQRKTLRRQITEGEPGHKGRRRLREEARPSTTAQFERNAGAGLSPRAKAIFDAATVELNKMRLLGAPDILIMTTMANSYADAEEAREEAERLRATGKKTRDVLQQIARQEKREDRKLELFLRCSDRLGLSPRSRENLTIQKQDSGVDDLMKLLMQPRPTKRIDPATGKLRDLDPITEEFVPEEQSPDDTQKPC